MQGQCTLCYYIEVPIAFIILLIVGAICLIGVKLLHQHELIVIVNNQIFKDIVTKGCPSFLSSLLLFALTQVSCDQAWASWN